MQAECLVTHGTPMGCMARTTQMAKLGPQLLLIVSPLLLPIQLKIRMATSLTPPQVIMKVPLPRMIKHRQATVRGALGIDPLVVALIPPTSKTLYRVSTFRARMETPVVMIPMVPEEHADTVDLRAMAILRPEGTLPIVIPREPMVTVTPLQVTEPRVTGAIAALLTPAQMMALNIWRTSAMIASEGVEIMIAMAVPENTKTGGVMKG